MIRAHSASAGLEFGGEGDLYLDVSQYPDMADLLSISDMLITDYSSCAGDFILRHKPVILAMFDYEEYVKNCRSFNFIPEEAGFIIAMNQRELELILDTYSDKDYSENCESIIRHFNITESGNSAAQICEIINIEYTNRILKKKV